MQAGRVTGAGQVIAIDPIKYRREFALKLGRHARRSIRWRRATASSSACASCAGDRTIADSPAASRWGRAGNAVMARGADFVVEAAGFQAFPPKVEAQPDPTNVKTVQQAWDCTRMGGHVMLMGFTLQPVSFPARRWRCSAGRFTRGSRAVSTSCATFRAT